MATAATLLDGAMGSRDGRSGRAPANAARPAAAGLGFRRLQDGGGVCGGGYRDAAGAGTEIKGEKADRNPRAWVSK